MSYLNKNPPNLKEGNNRAKRDDSKEICQECSKDLQATILGGHFFMGQWVTGKAFETCKSKWEPEICRDKSAPNIFETTWDRWGGFKLTARIGRKTERKRFNHNIPQESWPLKNGVILRTRTLRKTGSIPSIQWFLGFIYFWYHEG